MSKVCIYPLVSVTTSFVAEEDAIISNPVEEEKRKDLENPPPPSEEASPLESRKINSFVPLEFGLHDLFLMFWLLYSVSVLNG